MMGTGLALTLAGLSLHKTPRRMIFCSFGVNVGNVAITTRPSLLTFEDLLLALVLVMSLTKKSKQVVMPAAKETARRREAVG